MDTDFRSSVIRAHPEIGGIRGQQARPHMCISPELVGREFQKQGNLRELMGIVCTGGTVEADHGESQESIRLENDWTEKVGTLIGTYLR